MDPRRLTRACLGRQACSTCHDEWGSINDVKAEKLFARVAPARRAGRWRAAAGTSRGPRTGSARHRRTGPPQARAGCALRRGGEAPGPRWPGAGRGAHVAAAPAWLLVIERDDSTRFSTARACRWCSGAPQAGSAGVFLRRSRLPPRMPGVDRGRPLSAHPRGAPGRQPGSAGSASGSRHVRRQPMCRPDVSRGWEGAVRVLQRSGCRLGAWSPAPQRPQRRRRGGAAFSGGGRGEDRRTAPAGRGGDESTPAEVAVAPTWRRSLAPPVRRLRGVLHIGGERPDTDGH